MRGRHPTAVAVRYDMVVGYSADAAMWCPDCASHRYGESLPDGRTEQEGSRVRPVFGDQAHDLCGANLDIAVPGWRDDPDRTHQQHCGSRCSGCGRMLGWPTHVS